MMRPGVLSGACSAETTARGRKVMRLPVGNRRGDERIGMSGATRARSLFMFTRLRRLRLEQETYT